MRNTEIMRDFRMLFNRFAPSIYVIFFAKFEDGLVVLVIVTDAMMHHS
jgi:hypothetical protein